jgi:pilus assembly protein CpaE
MAALIRVLIVDDVQESRDNVERLLRFEPDIQIVGKAADGREAVDLALSREPTVIVMDVNMPDMDGIEATKAILTRRPNTGVVMMSVLNEPDTLRRSMLAGAREFLVKPFSLDELLTSVRTVHQMVAMLPSLATQVSMPLLPTSEPSRRTGKARILTFASSKGGVGRSVLATNFAVALRETSGQQVALVDANVAFGDVAVLMNVAEGKTIVDAVPYQNQIDTDLLETILEDHRSGVRLLLSPTAPQDAEAVTPEIFRDCLTVMTEMFDYIVVDGRPGFDDMNLLVFDVSDLLFLVTTMDMTAIKDARQFLEITDLLGYASERVRVVLNRSNTYSGIPANEIGDSLRRKLWAEVPDEAPAVLRSVNEGVPLVSSRPESKLALEVNKLVTSYLAEIDPEASPVLVADSNLRRSSLVGRLRVALRNP